MMAQSVLITGAARRIGHAIAEALAAQGWRVLVHARLADDVEAQQLAESLHGIFLYGDLGEPEAADRLFQEACSRVPDLCAIVNNASIFSVAADLPADVAQTLRRVNVDVPQRLAELLYAHLRRRAVCEGCTGAVVDLLDTRVLPPGPYPTTPYAAAKRDLFDSLIPRAKRYADFLRVNAVAPGPVLKPASAANGEPGGDILLPTRPSPKDIAAAVAYLLSAESVTGQTIAVDSGQALMRLRDC